MKHDLLEQLYFENEGAMAAINGKTEDDCPYNRDTNSFEWNHWIFGHANAMGEQKIIKDGFVTFCSTSDDGWKYPAKIPLEQAIKSGVWKPKYVTITTKSS